MFDFGNANEGQRKAIATAEGPVLITAGPGTGKTYTLVQRAIYLIEECGVKPESIFIATFTEKAAKELITRITNELSDRGIVANINEMYIGTFHSLCLRILKENLEFTRLRRNYRLLDAFDQQYMVFQNIYRFRNIPEVESALPNGGAWKQSEAICNYVNNLSEELVTPEELMSDTDVSIAALGQMLKEYRDVLTEGNMMDFSSIQIEAYHLLCDHADILEEMRSKVTHIILDTEIDVGIVDIRPARNLAKLTQIIGKFEYLHRVDVLDAGKYRGKRRIDQNTEMLFNLYLRLLYDGGITEYEDDSEYAPSGCVSFLTIHQSRQPPKRWLWQAESNT